MHPLVIHLVIVIKIIYTILILSIISIKIGEKLGFDMSAFKKLGIRNATDSCSLIYTFIMALVLFNLFRPAKKPRLVKGEEKKLLYLFGLMLCLEIIFGLVKGDAPDTATAATSKP